MEIVTFFLMLANLATYGISVRGLRLRVAVRKAGVGEAEGALRSVAATGGIVAAGAAAGGREAAAKAPQERRSTWAHRD